MFDVENQIIKVRVINFTEEHFNKLGYNVKNGDTICIPAKDLPNGSGTKIDVQCSYCGKIFKKAWRKYLETKDSICCEECKETKMMETNFKKYGDVCSLKNPKVNAKRKATWDERYGEGNNPLTSKEVRERAYNTMLDRYGVCHKSVNTSKSQKYLCNLYNGLLNYNISGYIVDILLKDNIVMEYDGTGHRMSVNMGQITNEEFDKKESIREKEIINSGYKIVRISYMNKLDSLPNDKVLLGILERAYLYFNSGNNIYSYNLKTRKESFSK